MGAWADTTVTVNFTDGIFYQNSEKKTSYTERPGSDTWSSYWESKEAPIVKLQGGSAWNLKNDTYYATTYTITVPAGYVISGYSITPSALPNGSATLTPSGGDAQAFSVGVANTVSLTPSVTGIGTGTSSTSFTLSDQVTASAFTITVTAIEELSFDAAPTLSEISSNLYVNAGFSPELITSTSQIDEDGYYIIYSYSGGGFISESRSNISNPNTAVTNVIGQKSSAYVFRLKKASEGFYYIAAASGNYVQKPTSNVALTLGDKSTAAPVSLNFSGRFILPRIMNGGVIYGWDRGSQQVSAHNASYTGSMKYYQLYRVSVDATKKTVTSTGDISNSKTYYVVSTRGAWAMTEDGTKITSTDERPDATDAQKQFAFIYYDANDKYYLYSVSESKFINVSGNYTAASATPADKLAFLASTQSNSDGLDLVCPWVLALQDGNKQLGVSPNYTPDVISNYNDTGDDGNRVSIVEASDGFDAKDALAALAESVIPVTYNIYMDEEKVASFVAEQAEGSTVSLPATLNSEYCDIVKTSSETTIAKTTTDINYTATRNAVDYPFELSSDYASAKWYVMKLRNKRASYSGSAPYPLNTTTNSDKDLWAFVGSNPYNIKVINRAAGSGKYLDDTDTQPTMTTEAQNWILRKNASGFTLHTREARYINDAGSAGYMKYWENATWAPSDAGCAFVVEEPDWSAFCTAYYMTPEGGSYSLAGNVGYPSTDASTYKTLYNHIENIFSGAHSFTADDYYNYQTYAAAFIRETNIVKPKEGKTYTIANYAKDGTLRYLYNNDGTIGLTTESSITDNYKFICHVNDAGKFIFAMPNGNYLIWRANDEGLNSNKGQTTLSEITENANSPLTIQNFPATGDANDWTAFGKLQIIGLRKDPSTLSSLIVKTGANPVVFDKASTTNFFNDTYSSAWVITELTDANEYYNKVTLTTDGSDAYASIYLPFAATIPTGITAYAVESVNGEKTYAHMETIVTGEGILKAGTAAILRKEGQTTNETIYLSPAEEDGSYSGENLLDGTVVANTDTPAAGTTYVLGKIGGVIGLYEYTASKLAPGKAYLNDGAGVKAFFFEFDDDATGINSLTPALSEGEGAIYNLAGQRLHKMQKGINIVNGKKILK